MIPLEQGLIPLCSLVKCCTILRTNVSLVEATNSIYLQLFTGILSTSAVLCMRNPLEIWKDEHIPEGPAMFQTGMQICCCK